jgi:hypothetical protein
VDSAVLKAFWTPQRLLMCSCGRAEGMACGSLVSPEVLGVQHTFSPLDYTNTGLTCLLFIDLQKIFLKEEAHV